MSFNYVSRLINHSPSHQLQMMYYKEGMQVINLNEGEEKDVANQEIILPTCNSADEYADNHYLTFRFLEQEIWSSAWIRVFSVGGVLHYTSRENPAYANLQVLPTLGAGSSFHLNYQFVSIIEENTRAIWVIGDIDLMPGSDFT